MYYVVLNHVVQNPFAVWISDDGIFKDKNLGFIALMSLVTGIALISIIRQGLAIMRGADDQKNVATKKSNIVKILIAYFIFLIMGYLIRQTMILSNGLNKDFNPTSISESIGIEEPQ